MEYQRRAPSVDDSLITSDQERDSGMNEVEDDEVLLLRMVESTNEPVSPDLKFILEKSVESTRIANQNHSTPSLVQRPRSSGIDLSAFSFARPATHGKTFMLQPHTKQSSAPPAQRSTIAQNGQSMNGESEHIAGGNQSRTESSGSHQTTTASPSPSEAPNPGFDDPNKQTKPSVNVQCITGTNVHPSKQNQDQVTETTRVPPVTNGQLLSPDNERQTTPRTKASDSISIHRRRNTNQQKISGIFPESPRQSTRQLKNSCVVERLEHDDELRERNLLSAPTNNDFRVTKCRRTNRRRVAPMQLASVLASNGNSELSEEDLFQLMIDKLKCREENEAAAASLKEQMEANISELTEENNALKTQLETLSTEMQKKTLESREFKSQVEAWKTKLGNFRCLLNELGSGYRLLRGEANQLKATRSSLNKDRKEIHNNIAETRGQLSQVSSIVEKSQSNLMESQTLVNSLTLALKDAEEKTTYVQGQLSDEKKRSASLETYIQDSSRLQAKKMGLIRADQLTMLQKLDFAFETLGKQVDLSQATTESMLREALDECHMSVKHMGESCTQDKLEVQKYTTTVHELSSQIKSITIELTKAMQKSSEVDGNRSQVLIGQLQSLGESLGSSSVLLKQLSTSEARCLSLQERLETFVQNVDRFSSSLGSIWDKEDNLTRQIEQLDRKLSEVQTLEMTRPTAAEIKKKHNVELKLQDLSTELRLTEESLKSREIENEELKQSLLEAVSKAQKTEFRANGLELETIALQDEIKTIETKIREELNRASVVARDQNRVKHEQQIHELTREKVELQKCIGIVRDKLAVLQKALDQNQSTYARKQSEAECILLEKEKQIQALEINHIEKDVLLAEKDMEIKRLREMEASITVQQLSVQGQLDEVTGKVADLERELTRVKEETIASSKITQERLISAQNGFLEKEEECTIIQRKLSSEVAARMSLETGKSKSESELYALLRRVQDSENWVKKIKETLGQMDSVSSKEQFSETWNRLMILLQPKGLINAAESTKLTDFEDEGSAASVGANATKSKPISSTTQRSCGVSGNDVVQATELIYCTQSFQRSVVSSPVIKARAHEAANGRSPCIPGSPLSSCIVPFSSLRQQLSPAPYLISEEDPNEIADMFIPTPEKKAIVKEFSTPVEHSEGCEMPASPSGDSAPTIMEGTKTKTRECTPVESKGQYLQANPSTSQLPHFPEKKENPAALAKTITFEAHNSGEGKRKAPDSDDNHDQRSTSQTSLMERPIRNSRRTYGRNRQSSQTRKQEQSANQNAPPPPSSNTMSRIDTEVQGSTDNKRAKASTSYLAGQQARTASGYFERKTSPTSLTSCSSRHSSMDGDRANGQRWPTRGSKGGGRRSRGDRYNTRFNRQKNLL
ncbi:hypothetical protein BBP40_007286 [Aspergillus hancockii]|nr:hypothetical protein BBP40_007286 [Aspergillus hancockii]